MSIVESGPSGLTEFESKWRSDGMFGSGAAARAPIFAVLMSGHFHVHLRPFVRRRLKRFTILRQPVVRTISHYPHVNRAPEHPWSTSASIRA